MPRSDGRHVDSSPICAAYQYRQAFHIFESSVAVGLVLCRAVVSRDNEILDWLDISYVQLFWRLGILGRRAAQHSFFLSAAPTMP